MFPDDFGGQPNTLYRNNGNGTFADVTGQVGVGDGARRSVAVLFTDFDNDRDVDIYVVNDGEPNALYSNNRDGTFSDVAALAGVADADQGLVLRYPTHELRKLGTNEIKGIFHQFTQVLDLFTQSLDRLAQVLEELTHLFVDLLEIPNCLEDLRDDLWGYILDHLEVPGYVEYISIRWLHYVAQFDDAHGPTIDAQIIQLQEGRYAAGLFGVIHVVEGIAAGQLVPVFLHGVGLPGRAEPVGCPTDAGQRLHRHAVVAAGGQVYGELVAAPRHGIATAFSIQVHGAEALLASEHHRGGDGC